MEFAANLLVLLSALIVMVPESTSTFVLMYSLLCCDSIKNVVDSALVCTDTIAVLLFAPNTSGELGLDLGENETTRGALPIVHVAFFVSVVPSHHW